MTHIFIDESGVFKIAPAEKNPWSVVGALAIAEKNLERLKLVVEGLATFGRCRWFRLSNGRLEPQAFAGSAH